MKTLKPFSWRSATFVIASLGALLLILVLGLPHVREAAPGNINNYPSRQSDASSSPRPGPQGDLPATDRKHDANVVATASEMRSAYTTLAQVTKLPGEAVDSTGKRLPHKFEEYVKALRTGPNTFYEGLSDEGKAAFRTIKESAEHQGGRSVVDLVQFASKTSHPSMVDVWLSIASAEYLSEYSLELRNEADAGLWSNWASLADSQNPIYRLLALTQAHRLTTNANDLSSFLARYADEEDVRIVHPLIYHLLEVGGPSAEESLRVISKRALERGDKKTSELATETLAKLR